MYIYISYLLLVSPLSPTLSQSLFSFSLSHLYLCLYVHIQMQMLYGYMYVYVFMHQPLHRHVHMHTHIWKVTRNLSGSYLPAQRLRVYNKHRRCPGGDRIDGALLACHPMQPLVAWHKGRLRRELCQLTSMYEDCNGIVSSSGSFRILYTKQMALGLLMRIGSTTPTTLYDAPNTIKQKLEGPE